jgi:hypothetical protein
MLIHPIEIDQTASAGEWSFNSTSIPGGAILEVVVKAATGTTTFNVTITDDKGNVIYAPTTATGTHREHSIIVPVRGVITIGVDTSSVDEAFTGRGVIDEAYGG